MVGWLVRDDVKCVSREGWLTLWEAYCMNAVLLCLLACLLAFYVFSISLFDVCCRLGFAFVMHKCG